MPKSDTWPGGVAMEPLSNMDSAGSCDSVITVNSGYSEDSMEHLSPEERACLMYLEETIEALEVQEDSGFSNDELDSVSQAEKTDISSFNSESEQDRAEHHALNQTSEPQPPAASAVNTTDAETPANLMTLPKPPVASHADVLCVSKDEDGNLKIVSQSAKASEIDLALIPPPSDFMDEPSLPPQRLKEKHLLPSAGISISKPGATINLEQLRQRASAKRNSVSSPVAQEPPKPPPELTPVAISPATQLTHPPGATQPKSPPAVAPKPKKLPANIILKSHKAAVSDGNSGHSVPTSSDRLLMDPQRIRIEALRKLGLLKGNEAESAPLSPKQSPKTRRSWAAPSSPVSPAATHTPPSTPSHFNSPPPALVTPQSPAAASPSGTFTAPAVQFPEILPAPAAFSDTDGPLLSENELPAAQDASEATINAQANTPPLTPPALVKHLTPPRVMGVKSATLERSGLGLSSYMAGEDSSEAGQGQHSPSHLRNNRPRPASLGSGKEFSSAQAAGLQVGRAASKEPDLRRSLPRPQPSGDSQKLPRSQGISVLICPREENGDNRREALKRLGLLRD